ncbi:MAG: sialidase family protein [Spirochaetaceae bacterium]|nr:sialidase family protein [Spirochaetaceae bacterium]
MAVEARVLDDDSVADHPAADHSDREILRYRRIRVERQEVLPGDTAPILCGHGAKLLLCGRAGSLARSTNGGVTWERLESLCEREWSNGHILTLADLAPDSVLAALHHEGTITILSSGDFGETWQAGGRIASGAEALALPARFEAPPGRSLSLRVGATAYGSSDGGSTWDAGVQIPAGAGSDEPDSGRERGGRIALPDGRLLLTYAEPSYPYGARAAISADGGDTWGDEVFVLGHARAATNTQQPRPLRCHPGAGAVSVALDGGTIVSAYDRGAAIPPAMAPMDGRRMDESSHGPAIVVVRWTPEGLRRPPLVYPNLSSHRVDSRGYLDNGLVRMRPDARFEGGDFIEDYEMIVFRRRTAEQRFFAGTGTKGLVVCRHPDGSLVFASRTSAIRRSTDEGRTWKKMAEVTRPGNRATTFAFGVTSHGTLLMGYSTLLRPADPATGVPSVRQTNIARSEDEGRTWTAGPLRPGPMRYGGNGDGSRITELSDGTVVMGCGTASIEPSRQAGYRGDVMLRSHDDGRTWDDWTVLPPGSTESNFLELPSGELLCATRYQRPAARDDYFGAPASGASPEGWPFPSRNLCGEGRYKNEAVMFSRDRGDNWTTPELVTRIHMVSADGVLLPDGRVVLTYDHKDACGGPRAIVSADGGRTWEPDAYVLAYHAIDARTSSVVLRDGRILTLWAGAGEQGVHATTWSPD